MSSSVSTTYMYVAMEWIACRTLVTTLLAGVRIGPTPVQFWRQKRTHGSNLEGVQFWRDSGGGNVREGWRGRECSQRVTGERERTFAGECSWGATFRATVELEQFMSFAFAGFYGGLKVAPREHSLNWRKFPRLQWALALHRLSQLLPRDYNLGVHALE